MSRASGASGKRTSKVMLVPRPGSLTALSLPFIMSDRLRQIDKPSPVPGSVTQLSASTW
ncbi:hypothetical protein D3C81_2013220 [compost metagenome]